MVKDEVTSKRSVASVLAHAVIDEPLRLGSWAEVSALSTVSVVGNAARAIARQDRASKARGRRMRHGYC